MLYSLLICSTILVAKSIAQGEEGLGFPTNIQGNIGLQGSGYGDVYGGKVKEGIYGAGGRVGGGLNLLGSAGVGRKKRQANAGAYANANGPDASAMANAFAGTGNFGSGPSGPGPVAPGPATKAPAPEPSATKKPCKGRRRRSVANIQPIPFPVIVPYPTAIMNSALGTAITGTSIGVNGVSSIAAQTVDGAGTVISTGGILLPGTRIIPQN